MRQTYATLNLDFEVKHESFEMPEDVSVIWTVGPDVQGDSQMQIDKQMAAAADATGSVLARLYHFTPPCVSLGCFQKDAEIDSQKCEKAGIDITRRSTGGRAVLHKGDLVYSIAVPSKHKGEQGGRKLFNIDVYNMVSRVLIRALSILGVDAGSPLKTNGKRRELSERARLCFSSTTRHEVQVRGRKVVGSAQRWYRNVVLQHGSILINDDHLELVELLPAMTDGVRQRLKDSIQKQTISLREAGFAGTEHDLIESLRDSFESTFGSLKQLDSDDFLALINEADPGNGNPA